MKLLGILGVDSFACEQRYLFVILRIWASQSWADPIG